MAITLSVNFSGTPDENEINAAELIVARENDRRTMEDPPDTALTYVNNAELKTAYLESLAYIVQNNHDNFVKEAKQKSLYAARNAWDNATEAQRTAALAALTT